MSCWQEAPWLGRLGIVLTVVVLTPQSATLSNAGVGKAGVLMNSNSLSLMCLLAGGDAMMGGE